jgi:hypothetical protein
VGEITRQGETLGDAFVGVRRQLAADPLGRLINGGRLAFFWIGAHRSSVVRFAAMSYGKILLVGAITFLIVTSYAYALPNKFTLVETKDGAYYIKMNNSTGQTYFMQTENSTDEFPVWIEVE